VDAQHVKELESPLVVQMEKRLRLASQPTTSPPELHHHAQLAPLTVLLAVQVDAPLAKLAISLTTRHALLVEQIAKPAPVPRPAPPVWVPTSL
jgi:hypothetical protein